MAHNGGLFTLSLTLSLSDWNVGVHSSGRGRDESVLRQTIQNFSREDLHQWPVSTHTHTHTHTRTHLHAHACRHTQIHSSLPLASLPYSFILIGYCSCHANTYFPLASLPYSPPSLVASHITTPHRALVYRHWYAYANLWTLWTVLYLNTRPYSATMIV